MPAFTGINFLEEIVLVVTRLLKPRFRYGLFACDHFRERRAFQHAGGNRQPYSAVGSFYRNHLEVGLLDTVLLRRAELPLPRVAVADMLAF